MAANSRVNCSAIFTRHNWQLAQAISDPGSMAADFNQNGIIPPEIKERAELNTIPATERATQLITSVSKAIRADVNAPKMFLKIISVLKSHSETREIALSMEIAYYGRDISNEGGERRAAEGIGSRGSGDDVTDNGTEETDPQASYQTTSLPRPPQAPDSLDQTNEPRPPPYEPNPPVSNEAASNTSVATQSSATSIIASASNEPLQITTPLFSVSIPIQLITDCFQNHPIKTMLVLGLGAVGFTFVYRKWLK